ncbi:hypothetical protein [Micromonospora sp. NPDC050200]
MPLRGSPSTPTAWGYALLRQLRAPAAKLLVTMADGMSVTDMPYFG